MKTAVSMWSMQKKFYSGEMNIKKFVDFAVDQGCDGVELLDCFLKTDDDITQAARLLADRQMPVAAFSIGNDFVTSEEKLFNEQVEYIKHGIDMAETLNAPVLRVFSGSSKPGITFEEGMKQIVNGLKACTGYAEKNRITMALENHGRFAGRSEQIGNIISLVASDYLKANIDTGNFLLVNENPLDAVKNLDNNISLVHFKDFRRIEADNGLKYYTAADSSLYQGTVAGKGDVPLREIVNYLKCADYKGSISVEYEGVGEVIPELIESIKFLKNLVKDTK